MTILMTYAGPAAADAPTARTGGVPLVPAGFTWPECAECSEPMQFIVHLPLDGGVVVNVFMCQDDPGMCDCWDAESGANAAYLFSDDSLAAAKVPADGETSLDEVSAISFGSVADTNYFELIDAWASDTGRSRLDVLGKLGGDPAWLQGDDTPSCGSCDQPMAFVAQFEEGHDRDTSINFAGGGCGYTFACRPCAKAAFLFQQ